MEKLNYIYQLQYSKVIHIIFVPKCQGKVGHITHDNNQILSPSTT